MQNYRYAAESIALTTLRSVIGDIVLDDVLAKREQINGVMQVKLDEVTERWGVKVNAVEIREILPPRDIQEAMSRQMSAERNRRAVVTEAEGTREAAVTIANGNRDAAILNAEGQKQSVDPQRRGRPPGRHPQRRGLRARAGAHLRSCATASTRTRWRCSTWT